MTPERCPETGKICYPTQAAAYAALRAIRRRRHTAARRGAEIHHCGDCHMFHIAKG